MNDCKPLAHDVRKAMDACPHWCATLAALRKGIQLSEESLRDFTAIVLLTEPIEGLAAVDREKRALLLANASYS